MKAILSGKPNIAAAARIYVADTPLKLKEVPAVSACDIHKWYTDSTAIYVQWSLHFASVGTPWYNGSIPAFEAIKSR
jgi:hypothetical protein